MYNRWNEASYYGSGSSYWNWDHLERADSVGGWIASTVDLARFLVHFDGFDSKPDLISKATYNLMTTPGNCGNCQNYAKGWEVNQFGTMWHSGILPGTGAYVIR